MGDSAEQIYAFDKHNPAAGTFVRSIEKVEVSKDAYSVANDAVLRERESQWGRILQYVKGWGVPELNDFIADRERSATFRAWMARFVVDSTLRSRGYRERMRGPIAETRLKLRERLKVVESDSRAQSPDLNEQWDVIFPKVYEMVGVDNGRKFEALYLPPFVRGEEGEKWYRWYEEGSWRFDEAPEGRQFITCDIPSNSLLLGPEPEYRNWMWFVMPLTPKLQLFGLCGDARRESGTAPPTRVIDDKYIDLANAIVFQRASRFVYASSETELLRASEQSAGLEP